MREIYLDDTATTKVDEIVLEAMKPFFLEEYGNPSSLHEMGERAAKGMNDARSKLANEIGAKAHEIIFTSSATESNNVALRALAKTKPHTKPKLIVSKIEHPSVYEVAQYLKNQGYELVEISVDKSGRINLEELGREIDDKTYLVSVIHANNIIGSVQDLKSIGKLCKSKDVLFHTDATQSFGKLDIDVGKMGISMLSSSAHKIGGPKGVGLLYIQEGTELNPWLYGGGQEKGIRSGTENVPGIVGFAKALELVRKEDADKIKEINMKLTGGLAEIGGSINSSISGLPNIINVSFSKIDGETLVYRLSGRGIYVSAGSACDSKKDKDDRVLKSISLSEDLIKGSIRITIGKDFKSSDVNYVVNQIDECVKELK
jgi:cysteine desulfurase